MASKPNPQVIIAIIGAMAAITVALIQLHPWSNGKQTLITNTTHHPSSLSGTVADSASGDGIGAAKITVIGRIESTLSRSDGSFTLNLTDSLPSVQLKVTKVNYAAAYLTVDDLIGNAVLVTLVKKPATHQNIPPDTTAKQTNTNSSDPDYSSFAIDSPDPDVKIAYPRNTTISWTSCPGADNYLVEIQYSEAGGLNNSGPWTQFASQSVTNLSYNFKGVGFQVHRYRISARTGTKILKTIPWRFVYFTG